MKYKLVIFDWDGTLMDSTGRIVSSMLTAAQQAELPVPSAEAVRDIIGLSMEPAFVKLFGMQHADKGPTLLEYYKQAYVHEDDTPSPLYKGAVELLEQIKHSDALSAVATGKARRGLERVWTESKIKPYFSASRCGDEAQSKPDPDMLRQLLQELDVSSQHTLMVGDTSYDMAMAQALDMDRVGLTHGAHNVEKLKHCQPNFIAEDLPALSRWLKQT